VCVRAMAAPNSVISVTSSSPPPVKKRRTPAAVSSTSGQTEIVAGTTSGLEEDHKAEVCSPCHCQICRAIMKQRSLKDNDMETVCSICQMALQGESIFQPPGDEEEFCELFKACVTGREQSHLSLVAHTACPCLARQHVVCLVRALPSARSTRRFSPGCCACKANVSQWWICDSQKPDETAIVLSAHGYGGRDAVGSSSYNQDCCMYCQRDDPSFDHVLLICEGGGNGVDDCPNRAHTFCCRFTAIPPGRWLCVECARGTSYSLLYA
jgi:hypothetical protein